MTICTGLIQLACLTACASSLCSRSTLVDSRRKDCFAAIPGRWPGRALPTSGCPQPGRPRSGCALGPFVPHAAHAPMGSLPYGQPSAPVGLRIRACSSPLRGLLPAACSARPTPPSGLMRGQRGARGQRASRPASGAHPTRGRPVCCRHALVRARPVHRPARAAKAHRGRQPSSHRTPPATVSQPLHQQPTPSSARQKPSRAVTAPLATRSGQLNQ